MCQHGSGQDPPHERRQPGVRKIGGQPGHPGVRHKLRAVSEVDQVEHLVVETCPDCKSCLQRTGKVKRQQVYELADKPVILTEFRRIGCYCESCNKVVYAPIPAGVLPNQQYGKRLQGLLAYLKGVTGASYSELCALCTDVFRIPAARSGICNVVMRASDALAQFHKKTGIIARKSPSLHIDESGWKRNGARQWVWVFCNRSIAFFSIEKTRGAKVVRKHLGAKSEVAVTSDFYGSYSGISQDKHQFCLAHLIRDIKFMLKLPDLAVKAPARRLLSGFRRVFSMIHQSDPPDKIKKSVARLHTFLVKQRTDNRTFRALLRRMKRHWFSLWRFIDQPELFEATNNRAERALGHFVRLRKMSQGSRSKKGDRWTERFCTLLQTSRIRNQSVWDNLCANLQRA